MTFNFNAETVSPSQAFDPLPDGWYEIGIVGAEMVQTKDGSTELLKLTYEVDGNKHPVFANRKVFDRLNVNHANAQPREIAQRNLSAICHAIGKLQLGSESDLLGGRLLIKVKCIPADGQYDARNEVKGYKATGSPVLGGPGAINEPARPAAPAQPATTAARTRSWGK